MHSQKRTNQRIRSFYYRALLYFSALTTPDANVSHFFHFLGGFFLQLWLHFSPVGVIRKRLWQRAR